MDIDSMEALQAAVLTYVEQYDHVSFGELHRRMELSEDFARENHAKEISILETENAPNVCWGMASTPVVDAVMMLMNASKVHLVPCSVLVYFADGGVMPRMPLAKRIPKNGYKEPHWVPCVIRPGAHKKG